MTDETHRTNAQPVDISVVIPTYNRATLLERTIPALVSQRMGGQRHEVIFVSNGSTDPTPAVLAAAQEAHPDIIRWDHIAPTGGPSAPRNRGIRMARAGVIVILDDDVLPDPDLVAAHSAFHRAHPRPEYCAVGEAYVPDDLLDDPVSLFHVYPYDEVRDLERLTFHHFWTCCVSFKRQFMLEHGMFDESLLYYEDCEVAARLSEAGMELRFVPEARGEHLHKLTVDGIAAKGEFTGRWLHVFEQRYPSPALRKRHGILHPQIGFAAYVRRLLNRAGLAVAGSPPVISAMRALGASSKRRSKLTDLYLYTLFRKNILRGYAAARRESRVGSEASRGSKGWTDRGES